MRRGFTLVETLVTVAIIAALSIAIGDAIVYFYRAEETAALQSDTVRTARGAFDSMVRDVREASYGADGSNPIAAMSRYELTIFADANNDGSPERILYRVSGTSLFKTITLPSGNPPGYSWWINPNTASIVEGVRNLADGHPLFRYYDAAGNEITDYSQTTDVASVVVYLVVHENPTRAPEFILESMATLRNLSQQ